MEKINNREKIFYYALLVIFSIFSIFPLYWMIASSIRPYAEVYQTPPLLFSSNIDFTAYETVLKLTPFIKMFWNSFYISIITTIICTIFSAMAGHSLARMKFRGKKIITRGVLIAYIFPQILLVLPLYVLLVRFGLGNSHFGLILTYMTFSFPFCVWMLTAYFLTIPEDLEEAAYIDGASKFRVFTTIILPLSKPGLAAAAIFTFIHAWNEFLYALVFLNSDSKATLAVGIYRLMSGEIFDWQAILASSTMMVFPILVIYLFLQKYIVTGLTAGATKG